MGNDNLNGVAGVVDVVGRVANAVNPIPGIAAEVGGSLVSSAAGLLSANNQQRFQEKMSGSAHQREVVDLEKAGLNPILSATGGSGASTPTGSMFTPDNPAKGVAQTLLNAQMDKQQYRIGNHQMTNIDADTKAKLSQASLNSASQARQIMDTAVGSKQLDQINANIVETLSRARANSANAAASEMYNWQTFKDKSIYNTWAGKILPWLHAAGNAAQSLRQVVP